jgi:hypothetical protein
VRDRHLTSGVKKLVTSICWSAQPRPQFGSRPPPFAHLCGRVAAAPMAQAPELLAQPPVIEPVDVLAVMLHS